MSHLQTKCEVFCLLLELAILLGFGRARGQIHASGVVPSGGPSDILELSIVYDGGR
jgi:hypothetical protein